MKRFLFILALLLIANTAYAITPVARFDVVPLQRLEYGSTFKIGVIAFSKPGMDDVVFTITGQGYASGTKTASEMTLNDRTGVWEYWVTLDSTEFSTDGTFTVSAVVTDLDANERNLSAITLIVEATGAFTPDTCWADSVSGNNTTCTVDNIALPCLDTQTCVDKIAAAGDLDGAIIYLEEGTYDVTDTASTSSEWLTITKSALAAESSVIINEGPISTTYLKYKDVTLQSDGDADYVATSSSTYLWTDSTRRIGSGMASINSNPVHYNDADNHYSTDDYTYDSDYAYRKAALVRGAEMVDIGNDAFENTGFVVNSTLTGITNGANPSWHADSYQSFTGVSNPAPSNRIIYGYKATDVHYQGVFLRSDIGQATDNAFVNVIMELRETADANETTHYSFVSLSVNQTWDHLLIWNCSFFTGHAEMNGTLTNSSIIGNYFYAFVDFNGTIGDPDITQFENGNGSGNVVTDNHFEQIYAVTPTCTPNTRYVDQSWPCPHLRSKYPDSASPKTSTYGDGMVDDVYTSGNFTFPEDEGDLIDAISSSYVPVDIYSVARGPVSDIGAVEHTAALPTPKAVHTHEGISLTGASTQ